MFNVQLSPPQRSGIQEVGVEKRLYITRHLKGTARGTAGVKRHGMLIVSHGGRTEPEPPVHSPALIIDFGCSASAADDGVKRCKRLFETIGVDKLGNTVNHIK